MTLCYEKFENFIFTSSNVQTRDNLSKQTNILLTKENPRLKTHTQTPFVVKNRISSNICLLQVLKKQPLASYVTA